MIFNREKAIKHTMNDEDLLKELLSFSLEDIPAMITQFDQFMEQEKPNHGIGELAHKIKGSAGAVSGEILYDAAYKLEVLADEGNREKLSEQIQLVKKAFDDFSRDKEILSLILP